MEPAPIQILSRAAFDLMLLSAGRDWIVSIREEEANPIPRPEFSGNRINLAFYDLIDGPNIATASHIEEVYRFSERWAKAARSDPATANLVVHCFVGYFPKFSDRDDSALAPERKGRGKTSIRNQSLGRAEHPRPLSDRGEISSSRKSLLHNQGCGAGIGMAVIAASVS